VYILLLSMGNLAYRCVSTLKFRIASRLFCILRLTPLNTI